MDRAVFIVRLSRDAATRAWRGVVELVGGDRRVAVSDGAELTAFIERSFDEAADEAAPDDTAPEDAR